MPVAIHTMFDLLYSSASSQSETEQPSDTHNCHRVNLPNSLVLSRKRRKGSYDSPLKRIGVVPGMDVI